MAERTSNILAIQENCCKEPPYKLLIISMTTGNAAMVIAISMKRAVPRI